MYTKTTIISLLSMITLFTGCGSDNSTSSNTQVKEFISLEQKANVEAGSMTMGEKTIALTYTAALLAENATVYTGYIGVFNETNNEQIIAMQSDDGEMPNFERIIINIPDIANGYACTDISYDEKKSTKLQGHDTYIIEAKECLGRGANEGKTQDMHMTLTRSMLIGGTSRITVEGSKAYLNTDYKINDTISIKGTGALGTRAYNQIFDLIHNHPEVKTLVEGHISGSIHDDINMQTGRLVRKAKLATHLTKESDISSGGVDLFCAGSKRTMKDGAKVGVHSWSGDGIEAGDLSEDSPLHDNQIAYFSEMLGDPTGKEFYFYTIHAAPAGEIYQMSRAEMESFQLLTQ
jgi:hypothetical protein